MWIIRRLKSLGCDNDSLVDVLKQQVISVLEQAVPYWAPLLTKRESQTIERVLKTGLHVIFQENYFSFSHSLEVAKMESLAQRRKNIFSRFCKQAEKSQTYSNWFKKQDQIYNTRHSKPLYKPVPARTYRFAGSALPAITQVVSWHPPLIYLPLNLN